MRIIKVFLSSALIALLCFVAGVGGFLVSNHLYYQDKILPGVHIERIPVGGLTEEEAVRLLESVGLDSIVSEPITLLYEDQKIEFLPSKLGAISLIAESVEDAFAASHGENYLKRLFFRFSKDRIHLPLQLSLNEKKLKGFLKGLSQKINREPQDATCVIQTDKVLVQKEVLGRHLEIRESIAALKKAIVSGKRELPLVITYASPKITSMLVTEHPPKDLLGKYTTPYGTHNSPNRVHNIALVCSILNHKIILPGESFSLVESVGEFTKEKGFKEAFVIVGGDELTPEYGGGSCQIATTLYNAVLLADLEILERGNHAIYFDIYPLGRDAAVYPGTIDFKFKNTTPYPIVIQAIPEKKRVIFKIFGTATGKEVFFTHPWEIGLKEKKKRVKKLLSQGQKEKAEAARKAFAIAVKRKVMNNGKVLKEETIKSYYKLHGTKHEVKIERPEPLF